jgi:hypothetical protein
MSPDPVSWFVIEPGWTVTASDGRQVGKVNSVVGDTGADIFTGLDVSVGLLKRKYVPSELVGEIVEGEIRLTVDSETFKRLDDFQEPPRGEQIRPS